MNDLEIFNNLVNELQKNGYKVKVTEEETYLFAYVTGKKIIAGFCTLNDNLSYTYINGKIAADHEDCFDKWSKCPLNLLLPKNNKQIQFVLDQLNFWASSEGYKKSNEYEFESWVKDYK